MSKKLPELLGGKGSRESKQARKSESSTPTTVSLSCLRLCPSQSHWMGCFVAPFEHFNWMICPPHQCLKSRCLPKPRSLPILSTSATAQKLFPNASSMLSTSSPSPRIRNRNLPFFLISTSWTIFVLLSVSWLVKWVDLLRRLSNHFQIERINLSKAS
jgi:hypothetical protein